MLVTVYFCFYITAMLAVLQGQDMSFEEIREVHIDLQSGHSDTVHVMSSTICASLCLKTSCQAYGYDSVTKACRTSTESPVYSPQGRQSTTETLFARAPLHYGDDCLLPWILNPITNDSCLLLVRGDWQRDVWSTALRTYLGGSDEGNYTSVQSTCINTATGAHLAILDSKQKIEWFNSVRGQGDMDDDWLAAYCDYNERKCYWDNGSTENLGAADDYWLRDSGPSLEWEPRGCIASYSNSNGMGLSDRECGQSLPGYACEWPILHI